MPAQDLNPFTFLFFSFLWEDCKFIKYLQKKLYHGEELVLRNNLDNFILSYHCKLFFSTFRLSIFFVFTAK